MVALLVNKILQLRELERTCYTPQQHIKDAVQATHQLAPKTTLFRGAPISGHKTLRSRECQHLQNVKFKVLDSTLRTFEALKDLCRCTFDVVSLRSLLAFRKEELKKDNFRGATGEICGGFYRLEHTFIFGAWSRKKFVRLQIMHIYLAGK